MEYVAPILMVTGLLVWIAAFSAAQAYDQLWLKRAREGTAPVRRAGHLTPPHC
jgi:hypothetical protein